MSGDEKGCTCDDGVACDWCVKTWSPETLAAVEELASWVDEVPVPTPDDTAAHVPSPSDPYEPYTYGARRRNPYYLVGRDIWSYKHGEPDHLMIAAEADVTDIIHAFGLGYDLGEVMAKICRLHRKKGTNIRQEFIKMHEHIQAAEDAWVASQEEQ